MIYVAFALIAAFVWFFVWTIWKSMRDGEASNFDSTWTRAEHPFHFWMNIVSNVICALGGAAFFLAILGGMLQSAG